MAVRNRVVGRRRDIKAHRRFARADMRSPLTAPVRPPRKATAAAERTFVAGLQKEARKRARKHATKAGRVRTIPEHLRSLMAAAPQRPAAKR
jgi:hypothetical protein